MEIRAYPNNEHYILPQIEIKEGLNIGDSRVLITF